jgi:hypothetical protein
MRLLRKLWRDTRGEVSVIANILLLTVLALGVSVGLVTLRNQIVQEFGDLSVALDSLDQSWSVPGGGSYLDSTDWEDPPDTEPAELDVQVPSSGEGS